MHEIYYLSVMTMLLLREYVTVLLGNSFCNTTNVLCLSIKHLITLMLYCHTHEGYLVIWHGSYRGMEN